MQEISKGDINRQVKEVILDPGQVQYSVPDKDVYKLNNLLALYRIVKREYISMGEKFFEYEKKKTEYVIQKKTWFFGFKDYTTTIYSGEADASFQHVHKFDTLEEAIVQFWGVMKSKLPSIKDYHETVVYQLNNYD